MMNTEPNTCPECGLDLVDDGCEKHCASCGLVFDAPADAPAPNQMLDEVYPPADALLEMEYEDRNGCGCEEDPPYDGGGWAGDGSGVDDLADLNANEADDYRDEGLE